MNRLHSHLVNSLLAVSVQLPMLCFAADDDYFTPDHPKAIAPIKGRFLQPNVGQVRLIQVEGQQRIVRINAAGPVILNARIAVPARTDEAFETIVFTFDGSAASARSRIESDLQKAIVQLDGVCHLTDLQQAKLILAGQRDINLFFTEFESARQANRNGSNRPNEERLQQIRLRSRAIQGILDCDSFLIKAMRCQLTPQQYADFREDLKARNHNLIDRVLQEIGSAINLTDHQRELITELIVERPSRLFAPPDSERRFDQREVDVTLYRVAEDFQKQIEQHAADSDWSSLRKVLSSYQSFEERLAARGDIEIRRERE